MGSSAEGVTLLLCDSLGFKNCKPLGLIPTLSMPVWPQTPNGAGAAARRGRFRGRRCTYLQGTLQAPLPFVRIPLTFLFERKGQSESRPYTRFPFAYHSRHTVDRYFKRLFAD